MSTDIEKTEWDGPFESGILAASHRIIEGHPFHINHRTGEVVSLEKYLPKPLRNSEARVIETVHSFESYVNRFKEKQSSIYVKGDVIVAEIDHRSPKGELEWADHTARLALVDTEEWCQWKGSNKRALSQEDFADLIEARAAEIIKPESAEMLEVAQHLHITNNSAASSYLRSGSNHSITFTSEKKATSKDGVEIPTKFQIRVKPFRNTEEVIRLDVRLKVKITSEHPVFIYEMMDLIAAVENAKKSIIEGISKNTSLPVYL